MWQLVAKWEGQLWLSVLTVIFQGDMLKTPVLGEFPFRLIITRLLVSVHLNSRLVACYRKGRTTPTLGVAFRSPVLGCIFIYVVSTVDWEIFVVKKFSPVAWAAKIKHAKIKYTLRASLRNRQTAKIKRAKI